jgi:oligopeptide transport system substrate-binding protein
LRIARLLKSSQRILVYGSLFLFVLASSCTIKPSSSTSTTSTTFPATTPSAAGQGTLNLADTGPITLDPAAASDSGSAMYILQIFGGLVRFDEKLQIVPDIASSWDRSPDGKTYTFHLRKEAKFHDGKQVTAADFKYSWERALNPATQSLTAGTYLNDISGAAEMLTGKAAQLSGVSTPDNYTLQVTITTPVAYFLDKMAYPTSFVVDRTNVAAGATWWQHPNGTGPFKLQQWQADQSVVLQRNDAYYGNKAKLAKVSFQLNSGDPMNLYQQGKIDVSYVNSAYMGMVTDPGNPISKELQQYPELSLYYVGFNDSVPPFDDVNVRQAFCYSVDKARVIALSTDNVESPAYGVLPPGMPGFNSNLKGLTFDPQKAKSLIASSKYGDVSKFPPIVLTTAGYGNDISGLLGGVIAEWRENLGVNVTVRQLEPPNFLYALNQEKNSLYDQGWIADYPDPQDFLDVLFRTGAQFNTGGYSNAQLDALLASASVEPDGATRSKLYQQAENIVVQEAPVLPLYFGRNYIVVKPYVTGYVLSPLGYPFLNQVSIQR